jgi:myo-inositol-1(or 4)-monophosphatase
MVREAGGTVSGVTGKDDALTSGDVVCGNETIHAELVKVLKSVASATSPSA